MNWPNFMEKCLDVLYKDENELKNFKNLDTNYQRVEYLIDRDIYCKNLEEFSKNLELNLDKKSLDLSESNRKKGNDCFIKKDNKNAFKFYTYSLLDAPVECVINQKINKSYFLSYSNRSAVFFDLNLFENCLTDIEACNEIINLYFLDENFLSILTSNNLNEFISLFFKLLNREVVCLFKLELFNKLKAIYQEHILFKILSLNIFKSFSDQIETKNNDLKQLLEEINLEENNDFVQDLDFDQEVNTIESNFINDCVDIKFSENKGRYCIAKQDIKAGECLFIEKPYCAILLPEFSHNYCEGCFKHILFNQEFINYSNIEACSFCNSVFYCSKKCKILSFESFHKYECLKVKNLLHNLGIAHLAYRILDSTSLELINKYSNIERENNLENNLLNLNFKSTNNLEENYKQVFYLVTHQNETHLDDLFKYSLTAVLLGKHYCNINKLAHIKLVSCLILRHLLQTICNAHAITFMKNEDHTKTILSLTYDHNQERFATAIYPRVSLLNHSCDSNVLSSFKQDSDVIYVKSAREIKKYDEILNCYGPHYLKMSLYERQQSLFEQYRFKCDCDACLKQSKPVKNNKATTGLKCYICNSNQVIKDNLKLNCLKCFKDLNIETYLKKFNQLESIFYSCNLNKINNQTGLIELNKMVKEYRNFLLINENHELETDSIDENFKVYYLNYTKLIDLIARINCNLKYFKQANCLIEKNIKILEFVYRSVSSQESSIEIAHELFKLAEIQCNCGEFQTALENIQKAISIGQIIYPKDNQSLQEFYELKNNIITILKA